MKPRALVYVQHLLGVGHLARMRRIGESLAAAGVATTLVQGGTDVRLPDSGLVDIVRLTPVKVSADDMTTLLHADGSPFTDADRAARRDALLAVLDAARPDILIVEAFPFGRRQMRFELIPFLDAARALRAPVIAASIRDLLQESRKPGRAEETVSLIDRYFDLVLVHGDEALTPLALTFPLAAEIVRKTRYTGLVGPPTGVSAPGTHDVVVSAGGGVVGARLLETAIAARPIGPLKHATWLVLAGQNLPEQDFVRLSALAAAQPGVELRRHVDDLPARLAGASLSVSQAGYNTVADIIVAGCRSVLCPFASGGETEQTMRAAALARSGRAVVTPEDALTPETLAQAMAQAMRLPRPAAAALGGGEETARILVETLAVRRDMFRSYGRIADNAG